MSEPTIDHVCEYAESAPAPRCVLAAALTLATQRAEAAEAENEQLRKAWQSADTTAQALSMNAGYLDVDGLRVGVHMVRSWLARTKVLDAENDSLRAERDALRKDAAVMDALQSETDRFDPVVALVVKCRHDRNGSDWANITGDIRAALDTALAVQPTTEGV